MLAAPQEITVDPFEADFSLRLKRVSAFAAEQVMGLYRSVVDDPVMLQEYGSTVRAYTQSINETTKRLHDRYRVEPQKALGYLVLAGQNAIGMITAVASNVEVIRNFGDEPVSFAGINYSGWLVQEYRNFGIISQCQPVFRDIVVGVQSQPGVAKEWAEAIPWTAVRIGNAPSEHLVIDKFDRVDVGALYADESYRVYVSTEDVRKISTE
jgi:hypothetical protein